MVCGEVQACHCVSNLWSLEERFGSKTRWAHMYPPKLVPDSSGLVKAKVMADELAIAGADVMVVLGPRVSTVQAASAPEGSAFPRSSLALTVNL